MEPLRKAMFDHEPPDMASQLSRASRWLKQPMLAEVAGFQLGNTSMRASRIAARALVRFVSRFVATERNVFSVTLEHLQRASSNDPVALPRGFSTGLYGISQSDESLGGAARYERLCAKTLLALWSVYVDFEEGWEQRLGRHMEDAAAQSALLITGRPILRPASSVPGATPIYDFDSVTRGDRRVCLAMARALEREARKDR